VTLAGEVEQGEHRGLGGPIPRGASVAATVAAIGLTVAGGAHLALLPHHTEAWVLEGVAFGVVGALQLGLAAALVVAPSRRVAAAALIAALLPVLTWAGAARWGLPVGPAAGTPEGADVVAWSTAVAELVAVVAACTASVRFDPTQPAVWRSPRQAVFAGAAVVAALAFSAAALATPLAEHSHEGAAHGDRHAADAGNGHAEHGHDHGSVTTEPPTEAERVELGRQLEEVRAFAVRHPTAATAEEAGYFQAGPVAEGSGAHYIDITVADQDQIDLQKPLALLYADTRPDAPVVGVMYYSTAEGEPEGFVGGSDQWHRHGGACYRVADSGRIEVPLAVDADVDEAMCAAVDGNFVERTGWMIHVWVAPGWESDEGVFSHDNPALVCPDGTEDTGNLATGCQPF
jgi:hypothetical protein